jgi:hypothetical protein
MHHNNKSIVPNGCFARALGESCDMLAIVYGMFTVHPTCRYPPRSSNEPRIHDIGSTGSAQIVGGSAPNEQRVLALWKGPHSCASTRSKMDADHGLA